MQLAQLSPFHSLVVVVVGLKISQQRVFLLLYNRIGFINGEVEFGDERRIHPGLTYIVTHLRRIVSRQKPHDDQQRHQHKTAQ